MKRLLILIPAYNEEKTLGQVLDGIPQKIGRVKLDILVIDDGSQDQTGWVARSKNVKILTHQLNCGLGAALGTGFAYATSHQYNYVMTFDADGQHDPNNIGKLLKPLRLDQADVVIGSRLLSQGNMPLMRRLVNWSSNLVTYLMFNIWTTDSQSGMRAFNLKALSNLRIRSLRMEVSSEIIKEVSRLQLRLTEIPIQPIYTTYSLSKGQPVSNAPKVFWKLVLSRLI